jgi:flagellar biogenesis protein FliO
MEADAVSQVTPHPQAAWAIAVRNLWQWARRNIKVRKAPRRLRVCETLSLGERRFLAVIEFDHQEFLVGGTGNSLELLARLQEGAVITEPSRPRQPAPLQGR